MYQAKHYSSSSPLQRAITKTLKARHKNPNVPNTINEVDDRATPGTIAATPIANELRHDIAKRDTVASSEIADTTANTHLPSVAKEQETSAEEKAPTISHSRSSRHDAFQVLLDAQESNPVFEQRDLDEIVQARLRVKRTTKPETARPSENANNKPPADEVQAEKRSLRKWFSPSSAPDSPAEDAQEG